MLKYLIIVFFCVIIAAISGAFTKNVDLISFVNELMIFDWYVEFYLFLVLCWCITERFRDNFIYKICSVTVIWLICYGISQYIDIPVIGYIAEYMPVVLSGYFLINLNYISVIINKFQFSRQIWQYFFGWFLITLSLVCHGIKLTICGISLGVVLMPIMALGICLIYIPEYLKKILEVLGNHSFNIWLLHGLFFSTVTRNQLQWIGYLPKNPIFVTVWIILLCLLCSFGLMYFQNKLCSKIKELK